MESGIFEVADQAIEQSGVAGYLCIDDDGLCIAARGDAHESMSGVIRQIANLASKIEEPGRKSQSNESKNSPVIRVDFERNKILIQTRDSITTALISPHK